MPGGAAARAVFSASVTALTTSSVEALPFLMMLEQHRAPAILAHDVLLHGQPSCTWPTSLTNTVAPFTTLIGMLLSSSMRRRRRVGAHGVLRVADLGRARRQGQVLGIDRVDDVERRQALGQQLCRIDIDHDLAVFPAGRRGQRDAVESAPAAGAGDKCRSRRAAAR